MPRHFLALTVAGLALVASPSAQNAVRPRPHRPGCRIYASSVTETSINSAVKNILTYKARLDPATAKLTVDTTTSSTAGTHFSIHQVAEYASVEDFVHEVVRASNNRGKSVAGTSGLGVPAGALFEPGDTGRGLFVSNGWSDQYRTVASIITPNVLAVSGRPASVGQTQAQWSVNTIPPLTFMKGSTITGDTHATVTNTFNGNGYLAKTVQVSPGGTDATSYSAWDSFGRPTAGMINLAAQSQTTVTIAYDDLQRTSTWSGNNNGNITTIVRSYDVNGVPVKQVHSAPAGTTTTTMENHEFAAQCVGPEQRPFIPSGTHSAPSPAIRVSGTLNATIDGRAWTPKIGLAGSYTAVRPPSREEPLGAAIVAIAGNDEDLLLELSVVVTDGPGTYTTELDRNAPPPDPNKPDHATVDVMLSATRGGSWTTSAAGLGRGTVVITSVSATGASGSFTVILQAMPGTPAAGSRVVSGSFNIRF